MNACFDFVCCCRSDTVFLATAYLGGGEGAGNLDSCDCNHRGGSPGFVKVLTSSDAMQFICLRKARFLEASTLDLRNAFTVFN